MLSTEDISLRPELPMLSTEASSLMPELSMLSTKDNTQSYT